MIVLTNKNSGMWIGETVLGDCPARNGDSLTLFSDKPSDLFRVSSIALLCCSLKIIGIVNITSVLHILEKSFHENSIDCVNVYSFMLFRDEMILCSHGYYNGA